MSNLLRFINNLSLQERSFHHLKKILETRLDVSVKEYNNLYSVHITPKSCLSNNVVRDCTGIILEKETNKIVHFSFSKSFESLTTRNTVGRLDSVSIDDLDFRNVSCEIYLEGTLIKVFWDPDSSRWGTGTSNTIYAYDNYWASNKSFYELFIEGVKCTYPEINSSVEFFNTLDKNYCYTYLLQHPENKKVMNIQQPFVTQVNNVHLETLEEKRLYSRWYKVGNGNFYNYNIMMFEYYPGSTVIKRRIKKMSPTYLSLLKLRGNNPNYKVRYLELMKQSRESEFKRNFPFLEEELYNIDAKIHEVVNSLLYLYVNIYCYKDRSIEVPTYLKRTVTQLHGIYKRTKDKINKRMIYEHLLSLNVKILLNILELNNAA